MDEAWLERAVEDELGKVIDRYRSQGKDVHNVGRLRQKVASDMNALRGTSEWGKLKMKYEPPLQNRLVWCSVCDKPLTSGAVTTYIEDRGGRIFCSVDCKNDPKGEYITLNEYKRRAKERGFAEAKRKEIVEGEVVEGETIRMEWEEIEKFSGPYVPPPAAAAAAGPDAAAAADDEIEWID